MMAYYKTKKCPGCDKRVPVYSSECYTCGYEFGSSCSKASFTYRNKCFNCGTRVSDDNCRCDDCGWFICPSCQSCGCDR